MAEIRHFRGSGFEAIGQGVATKVAPQGQSASSDEKYCVYNQTRERFVATNVEAADASDSSLEMRLRTLGQGGAMGLWVLPCLEISPASVRFPLDLVFLNNDCVVLGTVESFPLASPGPSSARAWSVLALPADTLAQGEIRVGDQLHISAPEEMKRHLQQMKEAKAEAQRSPLPFLEQSAAASSKEQAEVTMKEPVQSAFDPQPATFPIEAAPAAAEVVAAEAPGNGEPAPTPRVRPWKEEAESRNWLTRLLLGDSDRVDRRRAAREALPGLIAYFFTGGTPVGQPVRDVSTTGMYIITRESWYPGTIVQITLTDQHNATVERSITVCAEAVRSGSDGVGLKFVLEGQDRRKSRTPELRDRTNGVSIAQVEEFLRSYRS